MITIGVVGPRDLVGTVAEVCREFPSVRPQAYPYSHEDETTDIVGPTWDDVDGWLFTGIVPYRIAESAGVLRRPAGYVEYMGATLLRAIVELLRAGHDITRLSIDTLTEDQVRETLAEAGLSTEGVRVLPYRRNLRSDDVVAFHERARRDDMATIAITCLRSAYESLRETTHAVRLAPSVHSVRAAVRALLLRVETEQQGDAQVALGIIELSGPDEWLDHEIAALGGSIVPRGDGHYLVVTTRGPLERATGSFTRLPMLASLATRHETVRIGFGLGRSAAEAEALARRALGRAQAAGKVAASVALRNDIDILVDAGEPATSPREENLPLLAQRVGLSKATLLRLRDLAEGHQEAGFTTREVAEGLAVQPRTARRLLNRLERAGVAETIGTRSPGGSGRPLVIYRVLL